MSRAMHTAVAVDYPYSDGRPMAESDAQLQAMLYLLPALRTHYRDRSDVYVGGDMFVYYEKGNPEAVVAPDVFVVMGAAKRAEDPRLSYKLWEEAKGPDFVLEVTSRGTWAVDRGEKRALYARLGVSEYWLYDPTGERLARRLWGMRLAGGGYRDLVPEAGARALRSAVLGLELRLEGGGRLRLHDAVAGRDLLGHDEERAARLAAEARAKREAAARQAEAAARRTEAAARAAAETKVAELQAQLRELRGGQARSGNRRR